MGIKIKTLKPVRYKGTEYVIEAVLEIDESVYKDWNKIGLCRLEEDEHVVKVDEQNDNKEVDKDNEGNEEAPTDEELLEEHVAEIKGNWFVLKSGEKFQGKENALKRIKELIG
jgi:hypothetical protein